MSNCFDVFAILIVVKLFRCINDVVNMSNCFDVFHDIFSMSQTVFNVFTKILVCQKCFDVFPMCAVDQIILTYLRCVE